MAAWTLGEPVHGDIRVAPRPDRPKARGVATDAYYEGTWESLPDFDEVTLVLESDTPRSTSLCIGVSDGPASPFFLVRRDLFLTSGETEARLTTP